jgi:hypothetical protein
MQLVKSDATERIPSSTYCGTLPTHDNLSNIAPNRWHSVCMVRGMKAWDSYAYSYSEYRLLQTLLYGANVHCTVCFVFVFFDTVELGIYASLFFETVFIMLNKKQRISTGPSKVCTVTVSSAKVTF